MTHFRQKEDWMQKGAKVKLSSGTGILRAITEANMDGQRVILSTTVQRDGVQHAFPCNPWDIEELPFTPPPTVP